MLLEIARSPSRTGKHVVPAFLFCSLTRFAEVALLVTSCLTDTFIESVRNLELLTDGKGVGRDSAQPHVNGVEVVVRLAFFEGRCL